VRTIPRLPAKAKAALVEVLADEYGGGRVAYLHAELYRQALEALGLDGRDGAYLDRLPGVTLATVNLMSLFGAHARWRGALAGHLAVTEMTSSDANRRYGRAVRRHGYTSREATHYFDEHVEADAVHDVVAAHDLAGGLAEAEPDQADTIVFGARALILVERAFAEHLLGAWSAGRSSLR
jgi:pyrroloquinoline quinone (PQQ) biosynthesis protein C